MNLTNLTKYGIFGIFGLIIIMFLLRKRSVINFAAKYIGNEEFDDNGGFRNPDFDKQMKEVAGFKDYQQWCAYFVRFVFLSRCKKEYEAQLKQLISPSTQIMWRNALNNTTGICITTDKPRKGDIVIWQSKTNLSGGHTGIVVDVYDDYFVTIEGNYNKYFEDMQKYRKNYFEKDENQQINKIETEGMVAVVKRSYNGDGMYLKGFIRIANKALKII